MPKATLSFSLPDEREEFETAINAGKYHSALWDLREAFRQKAKYSEDDKTTWDEAYQFFWDTLKETGVEL